MAAKTDKSGQITKLLNDLNLGLDQTNSVVAIDNYFDKHRINELFNELMTNLLNERPVDARSYILNGLKSIQKHDYSREDPHNKNVYKF